MSSGIVSTSRYPLRAQTIARPMPVLPEVGSTSVSPGLIRPSRSAASTMLSAMRSFTEPAGFCASSLPSTSAAPSGTTRCSRTSCVRPIRSSTESAIAGLPLTEVCTTVFRTFSNLELLRWYSSASGRD